jgi:hypothetical protein
MRGMSALGVVIGAVSVRLGEKLLAVRMHAGENDTNERRDAQPSLGSSGRYPSDVREGGRYAAARRAVR